MVTCQWPWYSTPCLRHRLSRQRQSHLGSIKIQELWGRPREGETHTEIGLKTRASCHLNLHSSFSGLFCDTTRGRICYTRADSQDRLSHLFSILKSCLKEGIKRILHVIQIWSSEAWECCIPLYNLKSTVIVLNTVACKLRTADKQKKATKI